MYTVLQLVATRLGRCISESYVSFSFLLHRLQSNQISPPMIDECRQWYHIPIWAIILIRQRRAHRYKYTQIAVCHPGLSVCPATNFIVFRRSHRAARALPMVTEALTARDRRGNVLSSRPPSTNLMPRADRPGAGPSPLARSRH